MICLIPTGPNATFFLLVIAVPGHVLLHVALHEAVHPIALAHVAHELDGRGGSGGEEQQEEDDEAERHRGMKDTLVCRTSERYRGTRKTDCKSVRRKF